MSSPALFTLCATLLRGSILFRFPLVPGLNTLVGGSFHPRSFVMLYVRTTPPSETKRTKIINYKI